MAQGGGTGPFLTFSLLTGGCGKTMLYHVIFEEGKMHEDHSTTTEQNNEKPMATIEKS